MGVGMRSKLSREALEKVESLLVFVYKIKGALHKNKTSKYHKQKVTVQRGTHKHPLSMGTEKSQQ